MLWRWCSKQLPQRFGSRQSILFKHKFGWQCEAKNTGFIALRSKFVPFTVWHGDCHYLLPTEKQSLSLSKRFRFVTSWTWMWQIRGSEVVSYLYEALAVPTMVLRHKSMAESLFVWTHCQAWLVSTTMCLTTVMSLCQGECPYQFRRVNYIRARRDTKAIYGRFFATGLGT